MDNSILNTMRCVDPTLILTFNQYTYLLLLLFIQLNYLCIVLQKNYEKPLGDNIAKYVRKKGFLIFILRIKSYSQ